MRARIARILIFGNKPNLKKDASASFFVLGHRADLSVMTEPLEIGLSRPILVSEGESLCDEAESRTVGAGVASVNSQRMY